MKHFIGKWLCMLCVLSILLTGCGKGELITEQVYFYDHTKGKLVGEQLPDEYDTLQGVDEQIAYMIATLAKGSQTATIPFSVKLPIDEWDYDQDIVTIDLSKAYDDLAPQEKMITRAVLVASLTGIDGVEGVNFTIMGEPLKSATGEAIGINRQDAIITESFLDPNQATSNPTVTLYFANADGTKLVKEQRRIALNNNVSQEKYIIEELIKGPQNSHLVATVPPETVVKDVSITKDGICQVDLSFDIKSKFFTTQETKNMMIYSIVNSLTESSKINKVAFLVDGKKDIEFSKDINLRETFVRNESLIEDDVSYEDEENE